MPLAWAVLIGAITAAVVPYMALAMSEGFQRFVNAGTIAIPVGTASIHWSWPTFCIVTLLVWMLLRAVE